MLEKPLTFWIGWGKYDYKNLNDAITDIGITNYEREHDISIVDWDIVAEDDHRDPSIVIVHVHKSDNTRSLHLVYKVSVRYNVWRHWCPSDQQFYFLRDILPKFIRKVEDCNEEVKNEQTKRS